MAFKALLISPEFPPSYWGMRYALPFLGRKATFPPLGLLTVAALLPSDWDLKLIDLNVESLSLRALEEADLVLTSAMLVQRDSLERLVTHCRRLGKTLVAGGPYPTRCHATIQGIDHFVLGEAEVNLPPFLRDLARGEARPCYDDPTHLEISGTPPPRYDLAKRSLYAGAALQFSRGCPHACEFCDVVELFGRVPRTKTPAQFLGELDVLYDNGWRGSLFVVDDNFIGNRAQVRALLPELTRWQAQRSFPYSLYTEASLDLAGEEALMEAMVGAGFNMVFVGIETPDASTLKAVHKRQNCHSDLLTSVRTIQSKGLEVSGGFIVGFDQDREDIFDRQIRFIEEAAIPTAMVGLLTALPGTRLAERLASEGRLLADSGGGNNTHDLSLNFTPRMDLHRLQQGYLRVLGTIYSPRSYFLRCLTLIRRMKGRKVVCRKVRIMELRAFLHSLVRQTFSRYAAAYWTYLMKAITGRPRMTPEIIALAVKGHHFFTITAQLLALERFRSRLERLQRDLEASPPPRTRLEQALKKAQGWFHKLDPDLRERAGKLLLEFQAFADRARVHRPLPGR